LKPRAVCDASAVAALLLDSGPDGRWAADTLGGSSLAAPGLIMVESASVIRRHELAGLASADQATQAHADLLALEIELWPYRLLAARVWQLRASLSCYDASYVAVAELTGAPLVTRDPRITRAPGPNCTVITP
jgi:predicted nucleic acid-binding protein